MFGAVLRFGITVAALPLCAEFMDGVRVLDLHNALFVGAILAVIFTVLRPILRMLLSVINFCTMGLLCVAVDEGLVWTAVGYVENSVQFESFWWALAAALALNAARTLVDVITGDVRR